MTEFAKFGDMITLDHVDANSEDVRSFAGDRNLLVLYDLATGCLRAYSVKSKGASDVLQAMGHFMGGHAGSGRVFGQGTDAQPRRVSVARASGSCD